MKLERSSEASASADCPASTADRIVRRVRLAQLVITIAALGAVPVVAHAEPGGTIFGADPTTAGEGVRQFVRWLRNILFLVGVAGIGVGCLNYMRKKEWGTMMLGGALCMGFGIVASFAYALINGNAVDVNTDLGQ